MKTEDQIIIEADMTVNEIVQRQPATLSVFRTFGIDTCCGGPLSILEAATRHGRDVGDLIAALEAVESRS